MKMSKVLRTKINTAKKTDEFWMDSAKLDFALAIEAKRRELGKSYADLAAIMNTSNAYISKIFRGDANLTIESMVKLSRSVGCNLDFNLKMINEGSVKKVPLRAFTGNIKCAIPRGETEKNAGVGTQYNSGNALPSAANDNFYQYQNAS